MKNCVRCGEPKPLGEFSADKRASDGLFSSCRECNRQANNKRRNENKALFNENKKVWRLKNLNQQRAKERAWYEKVKDDPKWKSKHKGFVMNWKINNPEAVRENNRRHDKKERNTAKGKLSHSMSRNIYMSIKRGSKNSRHWESLVDFTIDQLKAHLEKRFKPGMTWGNYGSYWHIDHKIPESVFNFESPEDIDFKRCWKLKNLQPLEAKENMRKFNKLDKPFQPSLAYSKRV